MSEVAEFYSGKTVFVTGGTGFLGKVLIEKILYSCSNINKIYILVREKNGKSAQERVNKLFNTPVFQRVKNRPGCLSKIVMLPGNITETNFGLNDEQINCLINEVSIVFHLAATVNFNVTLQDALNINVIGTVKILKLCHRMKHIEAFIHVSTAFSNSERRNIEEVVYLPQHDLEQAQHFAKENTRNDDALRKFLGGKPNTYTYSKALAEYIVVKTRGVVPTAIVRPSIVIAALKEPCPGWIDNWNGSAGLFVGVPSGMLRVALAKGAYVTDLVPVDIVANLSIVAATRCRSSKFVIVYNCCTGRSNPTTMNQCHDIARKIALKHSLSAYPFVIFTSSHIIYYILYFLLQLIPSFIMDLWSFKKNLKMQYLKIQMKFNKMMHAVKFFLLQEWNFTDKNVRSLWKSMSKEDKELFNIDTTSIDWELCLENYILGARKYLLKMA